MSRKKERSPKLEEFDDLTPSKKMQDLTPIRLNPVCLLPCKRTYSECITELASIE